MIHLDRGHSSAIAHPKSNLILPDADQHSLSSWSAPTRNTPLQLYQEHPDPYPLPGLESPRPSAPPDAPPADPPSKQPAARGPITPADAEDPKLPEPSPASPPPTSPAADSSSSLSPPPDTATPSAPPEPEAKDGPPAEPAPQGSERNPDDKGEAAEDVDRASRQSTPLSELSSAPDDDVQESEPKGAEGGVGLSDDASAYHSTGSRPGTKESGPFANSNIGTSSFGSHQPTLSSPRPSPADARSSADTPSSLAHLFTHNAPNLFTNDSSRHSSPAFPASASKTSATASNPKVVAILELNMQLFSVLTAFQARGIPTDNPLHQEYCAHLQSNLSWLAAAADDNPKASQGMWPLPKLQPPTAVDFVPMDRIHQLYRELASIFAKDLARREQRSQPASVLPPTDLLNGKLKRDRPDELISVPDLSNKRRDTGDTKIPTPIAPAPSLSHSATGSITLNPVPSAASSNVGMTSMQGMPPTQMGSPSMPPPSLPIGVMGSTGEAQLNAARLRQMQARSGMHADPNRQMSPPAVPQTPILAMQNVAGPSSSPLVPQLSQGQLAAVTSMGPAAMQHLQTLQNPSHPLVQYLIQQVPGFTSLPLPQQLQHVSRAQALLQQRQRAAQQQAGGSTQNFMQPNMQSMSNTGMSSGQITQSSPTRVSPIAQQQSPMQGSSANSFPFPNHGPNSGADSRVQGVPQATFNQLTPQQRQLLLMQQQQMMRGGNTSNASMMNPQMLAAAQEQMRREQQLMAQMNMSQNTGSPIPGGVDGSQFPALRSNPPVPGIARSTRTPSDSAPSPGVSQRISGHSPDDLQRAMMMQQAQQRGIAPQMQQGSGFPQMNWSQGNQSQMAQIAAHRQGSYGMTPPNSAGATQVGFGGMQGAPSPAQGGAQNQWQQNTGNGQFPFVAQSPVATQHLSDPSMTPRQASATPVQQMAQNSPGGDPMNDFDLINADAGRAAATSAFNAFSKTNPQEAASTINGLRKAIPAASPGSNTSNEDVASSAGRVAAAAAAFRTSNSAAPRAPPRRDGSSDDHLPTQRKFGDVDVSSGKAMFSSLRNSTANKAATPPQVAPPTPSAFGAKKNAFAPPPSRTSAANKTPSPPPPPAPPARPQREDAVEGEWAEALYDYSSDDPGDLTIQEGQRLVIVEKSSDDWWTGEVDGRRGLVPATYVKML
ncbi:uncharacterized protein FIBRA_06134 [Fibroporia radiculosa]|uniref:SH3 domain-containing protein n=1 Tax=Fibroporia radiculosa TaxID=599839 RepID=J4GAQ2_9APHY|nr:uncharacterized protein FIBRA_06134 [Fibroporia radiculosa]CCM03978.1 predicted protein [Fibroporia radiculosa]